MRGGGIGLENNLIFSPKNKDAKIDHHLYVKQKNIQLNSSFQYTLGKEKKFDTINLGLKYTYNDIKNTKLTTKFNFGYSFSDNALVKNLLKDNYITIDKDDLYTSFEFDNNISLTENFNLTSGAFIEYIGRSNNKIQNYHKIKSNIPKGYMRLHFKDIGEKTLNDNSNRGLWLWGYTDEASDSKNNGYPKNKKKFNKLHKDEFGYYIDVKKKTDKCDVTDNNCNNKKLGFLIINGDTEDKVNHSEKYPKPQNGSDSSDRYVDVINDEHNEVWINENFSATNHNQYLVSSDNHILSQHHKLLEKYWDNEKQIAKNENYLNLNPNAPESVKKPYIDNLKKYRIEKNKIQNEMLELKMQLSNILIYGFNFGIKYTGIKNLTLSANATMGQQIYKELNKKETVAKLNINEKYNINISKNLALIQELDTTFIFENIKANSFDPSLKLTPTIKARYSSENGFNVNLGINVPLTFKNKSNKLHYDSLTVNPFLEIQYMW